MKIRVYATMSPEYMFETGRNAGLSPEAADYFRYFEEVELELDVNPKTGAVLDGRIIWEK